MNTCPPYTRGQVLISKLALTYFLLFVLTVKESNQGHLPIFKQQKLFHQKVKKDNTVKVKPSVSWCNTNIKYLMIYNKDIMKG